MNDAERRASLARLRLQALVSRAFPHVTSPAGSAPGGVAIAHDHQAFLAATAPSPSPLASLLVYAERGDATELHLVVDDPDPVVVLGARGLAPPPTVWRVVGTELIRIDEVPAAPTARPTATALDLIPVLEAAGCEVVVEHGVVLGEVAGVEVARIVVEADGEAVVRVGVGVFDQEADAVMHPDGLADARLERVVAEVRAHRRAGAATHPLNLMARGRWLRSQLLADPAVLGLDSLTPIQPVTPRTGIRDERPAAALGRRDGADVLVVCSAGVDLDLVPEAAAQLALHPVAEVVLVLPERDQHPVIAAMAARLRVPATLTVAACPWETASPRP